MVFRVGTVPLLTNRNAGNALGVADFLARADDPMSSVNTARGEFLYAYAVAVPAFGTYDTMNAGRGNIPGSAVGRKVNRDAIWYSFPEGVGYQARVVAKIPLSDVRAALRAAGYADFEEAGAREGARIIRELFATNASAGGSREAVASGAPVGATFAAGPAERLGVSPAWATPSGVSPPPLTLTPPPSQAEPGLPKYAADKSGFNLSLLPTEGPRKLVDRIARDRYAEWRGQGAEVVLPTKKTLALSQALGWNAELKATWRGRAWTRIWRLGRPGTDAAHQLYLAQQKAALSGSYEDKLAFERTLAENAVVLADFAGLAYRLDTDHRHTVAAGTAGGQRKPVHARPSPEGRSSRSCAASSAARGMLVRIFGLSR